MSAQRLSYSPHIDRVSDHSREARHACYVATQGYRWKTPQQTPARGSRTSVLARQARLIASQGRRRS